MLNNLEKSRVRTNHSIDQILSNLREWAKDNPEDYLNLLTQIWDLSKDGSEIGQLAIIGMAKLCESIMDDQQRENEDG